MFFPLIGYSQIIIPNPKRYIEKPISEKFNKVYFQIEDFTIETDIIKNDLGFKKYGLD